MPSFKGSETIILQPNDTDIPHKFNFPIKSSEDATEGDLPFDTTLLSATVNIYDSDDVDVTSDILVSDTNDTDSINVILTYPSINGAGYYKITFLLYVSNGSTMERDADRIIAGNL